MFAMARRIPRFLLEYLGGINQAAGHEESGQERRGDKMLSWGYKGPAKRAWQGVLNARLRQENIYGPNLTCRRPGFMEVVSRGILFLDHLWPRWSL